MTTNQKIKELSELENNLPKKELKKPVILELQIANNLEQLANLQNQNQNSFGITDQLGEINSQIVINFDIKTLK